MEKMFKTYNGENTLKPGNGILYDLARHIENCVSLPSGVILFFCQMLDVF